MVSNGFKYVQLDSNGFNWAQSGLNGFKWAQEKLRCAGKHATHKHITFIFISTVHCSVDIWQFFPSLRFNVKSILVIFKALKTANFNLNYLFEQLWILIFWVVLLMFQIWIFSKSQNSKPPELLKCQFLTLWNQPKLISCKIWVTEKFSQCRKMINSVSPKNYSSNQRFSKTVIFTKKVWK